MSHRHAAASPSRRKPEYSPQMHREMVAVAAYYRAERRGFAAGDPTADWLEAEAEIEQRMNKAPETAGDTRLSPKLAFQQKFEDRLRDWDARLEQLKAKARDARSEIGAEFEIQLEALAAKRSLAQETLRELRQHGEWAWEDLKAGADKAWKDLREAMERAASRLK